MSTWTILLFACLNRGSGGMGDAPTDTTTGERHDSNGEADTEADTTPDSGDGSSTGENDTGPDDTGAGGTDGGGTGDDGGSGGSSDDGSGSDGGTGGTDGGSTDGGSTDGSGTDGSGTDGGSTDGGGTDGSGTDGGGTDGDVDTGGVDTGVGTPDRDGTYTGTIDIEMDLDFSTAPASCHGEIELTVESTATTPIIGIGWCEAGSWWPVTFDVTFAGAVETDPDAAGTGTVSLGKTVGNHEWEGLFTDDGFEGTLEGTISLYGVTEHFTGTWSAER